MKKIIALTILACMLLSFAGCGSATAEYKLGMGVSVSTDSSAESNAQVDATVATVVMDKDGKIVACRLDCAQNKMDVTGGAVDTAKEFKTKVELQNDYNMVAYSDATLEWFEQAKNFENYVVGKTAAEVQGTALATNDHGYTVAADEELHASCSIDITAFLDAIAKACADDQAMTFTSAPEFTLGLAAISTADESTAATAEAEGVVKMYTEFAAVVLGKDGKILANLTDAIQPQIKISAEGAIGEISFKGTKRELKADYGMVAYSDATIEWFEQAAAFEKYLVGKTAAEVGAIETTTNAHGYAVAADETLYAGCTIQITGMMNVAVRAAEYAR